MPRWQVIDQKYTERYMNNRFVDVVVVTVQASDGVTADLIIPQAQYTKDNVTAQAENWYATHADIAGLSG